MPEFRYSGQFEKYLLDLCAAGFGKRLGGTACCKAAFLEDASFRRFHPLTGFPLSQALLCATFFLCFSCFAYPHFFCILARVMTVFLNGGTGLRGRSGRR